MDLGLTVKSGDRGRLAAKLELALLQKQSRIQLRTPFTMAELLRHPPTKEAALRTPVELDADVHKLRCTSSTPPA